MPSCSIRLRVASQLEVCRTLSERALPLAMALFVLLYWAAGLMHLKWPTGSMEYC
jgi:hypothetical protein